MTLFPLPALPGFAFAGRDRLDGTITYEKFRFDGGLLERQMFGSAVFSETFTDEVGALHRADGPAHLTWSAGSVRYAKWFFRGAVHREGGPAVVTYLGGAVTDQEWWRGNVRSRIDGPAVMRTGGKTSTEWWVGGQRLFGTAEEISEGIAVGLLAMSAEDRVAEILGSAFEPLLVEGVLAEVIVAGIGVGARTAEGIRAYVSGAPIEWVRSFESGSVLGFVGAGVAR